MWPGRLCWSRGCGGVSEPESCRHTRTAVLVRVNAFWRSVVGMYLRETRRRNRDGSEVAYLALAHNERDPDTGVPKARIIHNFGRADLVDRDGLARLVKSISRFLDPADAVAATAGPGEVQVIDSRPMGTAWVADRLWERLGIGERIIEAAGRRRGPGRRIDAAVVERVIFAMVANRLSPTPLSKLAGCSWVADRVFIPGLTGVSDDACYRAMDVFLGVLAELQEAVFFSVANLLNLEVDILFFDTSSTYWETDSADDALLDDDDETGDASARAVEGVADLRALQGPPGGPAPDRDRHGRHPRRDPSAGVDLPRQHQRPDPDPHRARRPVGLAAQPGDLGARPRVHLRREPPLPPTRRRALHRRRETPRRLRRGRRCAVTPGPLPHRLRQPAGQRGPRRRRHGPGPVRDLPQPRRRRARRHGSRPDRDPPRGPHRRQRHPQPPNAPSSPAASAPRRRSPGSCAPRRAGCSASTAPRSAPTRTSTASSCCAPQTRASPPPTSPRATRASTKPNAAGGTSSPPSTCAPSTTTARTASAPTSNSSGSHCSSSAIIETTTGDTWRNIRDELERLHLVTLATTQGQVAQRSELTPGHRRILGALDLPEPPRYFDFTPIAK